MAKANKELQEPSILTTCLRRLQILLCMMLVCLCIHHFLSLEQLRMEKCMTHLTIHLMGSLKSNAHFLRGRTLQFKLLVMVHFILKKGKIHFTLKNHTCGCFVQIQEQLGITGLKWCDFCVYLSKSNEMTVERIYFNEDFWTNNLLPKLSDFFLKHALPCLASD